MRQLIDRLESLCESSRKRKKPKPGDIIYYGGMVFKIGPNGGHIPQPQITPTSTKQ